ncbi:hypothetical protein PVAP13_4KG049866 [Panicum virgatum]|uniref:Uncharacterized protein n=1 Tax=Panicum virgatum TaxID=38727 RepID=A0A8T0TNW0_PANVG|nr:hypothetical protein PVAP13_4KG049866 [Panicum virgatum]
MDFFLACIHAFGCLLGHLVLILTVGAPWHACSPIAIIVPARQLACPIFHVDDERSELFAETPRDAMILFAASVAWIPSQLT